MKNVRNVKKAVFFLAAVLCAGISFAQNKNYSKGNVYDVNDSISNTRKDISASEKWLKDKTKTGGPQLPFEQRRPACLADRSAKTIDFQPGCEQAKGTPQDELLAASIAKKLNGDTKDEAQKQKNIETAKKLMTVFKESIGARVRSYNKEYDSNNLVDGDDFSADMGKYKALVYHDSYLELMNPLKVMLVASNGDVYPGSWNSKIINNVLLAYKYTPGIGGSYYYALVKTRAGYYFYQSGIIEAGVEGSMGGMSQPQSFIIFNKLSKASGGANALLQSKDKELWW